MHRAPTVVDFVNIRWVDEWCKRCNICVEICPTQTLVLTHDAIVEAENCIRCGLCERYCPDIAIEVLPKRDEAVVAAGAGRAAASAAGRGHARAPAPQAARGPAVAGKDSARGIDDAESAPAVDRSNPT